MKQDWLKEKRIKELKFDITEFIKLTGKFKSPKNSYKYK